MSETIAPAKKYSDFASIEKDMNKANLQIGVWTFLTLICAAVFIVTTVVVFGNPGPINVIAAVSCAFSALGFVVCGLFTAKSWTYNLAVQTMFMTYLFTKK